MRTQQHILATKTCLAHEQKKTVIQKRKQSFTFLFTLVILLISFKGNTQTTINKRETKTHLIKDKSYHPKMISGTVTNNAGLPLSKTNIFIKGTNNGTQTSIDGTYSIKTNLGDTLVFSYIGYAQIERSISPSITNVDAVLTENETILPTIWVSERKEEEEKKPMNCTALSIKPFSNVSFRKDLALEQERQLRAFATAQTKAFQKRKRDEKRAAKKQREVNKQE